MLTLGFKGKCSQEHMNGEVIFEANHAVAAVYKYTIFCFKVWETNTNK